VTEFCSHCECSESIICFNTRFQSLLISSLSQVICFNTRFQSLLISSTALSIGLWGRLSQVICFNTRFQSLLISSTALSIGLWGRLSQVICFNTRFQSLLISSTALSIGLWGRLSQCSVFLSSTIVFDLSQLQSLGGFSRTLYFTSSHTPIPFIDFLCWTFHNAARARSCCNQTKWVTSVSRNILQIACCHRTSSSQRYDRYRII